MCEPLEARRLLTVASISSGPAGSHVGEGGTYTVSAGAAAPTDDDPRPDSLTIVYTGTATPGEDFEIVSGGSMGSIDLTWGGGGDEPPPADYVPPPGGPGGPGGGATTHGSQPFDPGGPGDPHPRTAGGSLVIRALRDNVRDGEIDPWETITFVLQPTGEYGIATDRYGNPMDTATRDIWDLTTTVGVRIHDDDTGLLDEEHGTDPDAPGGGPQGDDGEVRFVFSRDTVKGDVDEALTVHYELDGTATPGSDYGGLAGGTVTIPAGEQSVVKTVTAIDDADTDGQPEGQKLSESIVVRLLEGEGYLLPGHDQDPPTPPPEATAYIIDGTGWQYEKSYKLREGDGLTDFKPDAMGSAGNLSAYRSSGWAKTTFTALADGHDDGFGAEAKRTISYTRSQSRTFGKGISGTAGLSGLGVQLTGTVSASKSYTDSNGIADAVEIKAGGPDQPNLRYWIVGYIRTQNVMYAEPKVDADGNGYFERRYVPLGYTYEFAAEKWSLKRAWADPDNELYQSRQPSPPDPSGLTDNYVFAPTGMDDDNPDHWGLFDIPVDWDQWDEDITWDDLLERDDD